MPAPTRVNGNRSWLVNGTGKVHGAQGIQTAFIVHTIFQDDCLKDNSCFEIGSMMDTESLGPLLYKSAVLNVAVRTKYAALKGDQDARYFVYVLLLQSGKFYVGSTDNPYIRFLDHFMVTSSSAVWVKEWGPPVRVVELMAGCTSSDEQYKYMEYASLFGWENVRGGTSCRLIMSSPPPGLEAFERDTARPCHYISRKDIDAMVQDVHALARSLNDLKPPRDDDHKNVVPWLQ